MRKLGVLAIAAVLLAASDVDVVPQADGSGSQQVDDGPRQAVDQLFLGMRMASESMAREVLAPDVRFAVLTEEGTIAAQSMETFIRALGASQGAWNEQIYDVEVRVDGAMASVWAPYTFYLSGRISHCGINSIELLRDADGWRITQVSDTRRTDGCPDPLG